MSLNHNKNLWILAVLIKGTLINSDKAILESFEKAYEKFSLQCPSPQAIKAQIGYPLDDMFETLGIEKEKLDAYVDAYKEHYRKIACLKTVLLPNALEAIKLADKYATLGVVTTKTAKYSIELLKYFGVMEYFDVLIGREDVINPKPHPEPIEKALLQLPIDTDEIYMIGDTPMDMISATKAGAVGVGVVCGYGKEEDLRECSEHIYANSLEAVQFIVKNLL